ncbi:MAG TPA: hypothetical protein VEA40_11730 [Ramlibacter sp.]|nr:hypothetical protein [Ramlibacter sp.]
MQHLSPTLIKNMVVAATLGLAAIATWAFTDTRPPTIEAATEVARQG